MNEKLSTVQIAFVIQLSILAGKVIGIPSASIEAAGTGAWVSIAINTIITIGIAYVYIYLGLLYRGKTIYEYSELIVGKIISKIFLSLYIVFFFLEFISSLCTTAYFTKYSYLLKTPIWAIQLTILLTSVYVVIKGLNTIGKTCVIYSITTFFVILILVLLSYKRVNILNLFPIFNIADFNNYLKGSLNIGNYFFGVVFLCIIPFTDKVHNKKIYKYIIFSLIYVLIVYCSAVEIALGVLGEKVVLRYNTSILVVARSIEAGFAQFIGRLDGVLFIDSVMVNSFKIAICIYAVTTILKRSLTNIPYKIILLSVSFFGLVIALIPGEIEQVMIINQLQKYIGILCVIVIPILLMVISRIKR